MVQGTSFLASYLMRTRNVNVKKDIFLVPLVCNQGKLDNSQLFILHMEFSDASKYTLAVKKIRLKQATGQGKLIHAIVPFLVKYLLNRSQHY